MDKKTAEKLLYGTSREEMIKIITKLLNYSKKGEHWLLEYCRQNANKNNQTFIAEKQFLSYWKNAKRIIDECNRYGGSPREDEGYDELYAMQQLVKEYDISWELRKEIIDGMMEQLRIGNSGFDDSLVDAALDFCKTKGENLYLAKMLSEYGGEYYKKFAANLYLEFEDEKSFLEIQQKNLHYGSDYIKMADYYKNKGDINRAVSLVEDALQKAVGRMDEVYSWLFQHYRSINNENKILELYEIAYKKKTNVDTIIRLLYEYYKEKNNYEKQMQYLLLMMEYCKGDTARYWFDACKRELHCEDFENNKQKIYEYLKKHNLKEYCEILMIDGNEIEVLQYLKEGTSYTNFWSLDYEHNFSRRLAEKFPKEIILYYQKECEYYCSMGGEKNYQYAVHILNEIKNVMKKNNMQKEWDIYFDEFIVQHKRKKNLMKLIELK